MFKTWDGQNSIGIGIDMEDIARFSRLQKNDKLIDKIFTAKERAYCFSKRCPAQHLAARYAAKEAAIKGLSALLEANLYWYDYHKIELITKPNGAPEIKFLKRQFNQCVAQVSISHCQDKAIALVVLKKL